MDALIVDDSRAERETLASLLSALEHEVRLATGSVEALEMMSEVRPGVVFCDVVMPGMNGLLFLRAASARFPSTPVVLMVAPDDVAATAAAYRSDAFDYLEKPVQASELAACLGRIHSSFVKERR
jgi:two-component system, NtrC family, nitrogen regulation response regulator GlnG